MNEEFLYYIWQFKLWKGDLRTFSGEEILVEKPGFLNTHAGPDFQQAKIKIGDVLWSGNVEIHTKTSDWYFHGHEHDVNYQNLILHVVWQNDLDDLPHDCPLLELGKFVPKDLIDNYQKLQFQNQFIPCENLFAEVDDFTKTTFLEALFIERMQQKSNALQQRLHKLNGDWEALTFERLAYVFGLKINAEAFQLLAKSFDFKILQQIVRKNENLEAFLFGQAGFLTEPKDDYTLELKQEYDFLQHKYNTKPIDNHLFKFLRLRPPNFPTMRLAQLAAVYTTHQQLFNHFVQLKNIEELKALFLEVSASEYWEMHYNFGKISPKKHSVQISQQLIEKIALNAVIPLQFLFGLTTGKQNSEQILTFVESIKPEQNSILENYKKINAKITNALESQAYLELYKNFCAPKKCLTCRIGNNIMQYAR